MNKKTAKLIWLCQNILIFSFSIVILVLNGRELSYSIHSYNHFINFENYEAAKIYIPTIIEKSIIVGFLVLIILICIINIMVFICQNSFKIRNRIKNFVKTHTKNRIEKLENKLARLDKEINIDSITKNEG